MSQASTTAAQRKAWNEAMRGVVSGAAAAALPGATPTKKRTTRSSKQSRRDKARKSTTATSAATTAEEVMAWQAQQAAAWMDALEDVPSAGVDGEETTAKDGDEDDDEYDELEELEEEEEEYESGKNKRRKRGGNNTKKKKPTRRKRKSAASTTTTGTLPKRFKLRSLASILSEEVSHPDGVAKEWLDNEARNNMAGIPTAARTKYCPVTGLQGIYTDPKTGLPYANLAALEQIRERPPPWTTLGGVLAYHEVVKSIRDE